MKIAKQALAALSAMLMIVVGCGSKPAASGIDELDVAIRDASDYLNDNIPAGSKIVILNIQSSSSDLSDYVIDELLANAVNDKIFSVVDRQQLDMIRSEQNFQTSGEVDDNSAMEIGKFFGAQTIVSGAVNRLGTGYRIRIRALEVQTAQVQGQYNRNIASSLLIAALMEGGGSGGSTGGAGTRTAASSGGSAPASDGLTITGLSSYNNRYIIAMSESDTPRIVAFSEMSNRSFKAGRVRNGTVALKLWTSLDPGNVYSGSDQNVTFSIGIVAKEEFRLNPMEQFSSNDPGTVTVNFSNGRGSGNFVPIPAQSTTPSPSAYKVGDTGPAGGLIFYDKGNNSNGWRYLEATPEEAEFQAVWSVRYTVVENTRDTIGSGMRNTQLIVETFSKTSGEWDTAAQKCDDLVFGGFDDWFLPSKAELDQMYGNLKRRNLGDFKNGYYWSSTGRHTIECQHFGDGGMTVSSPNYRYYVRPIRQVAGQ